MHGSERECVTFEFKIEGAKIRFNSAKERVVAGYEKVRRKFIINTSRESIGKSYIAVLQVVAKINIGYAQSHNDKWVLLPHTGISKCPFTKKDDADIALLIWRVKEPVALLAATTSTEFRLYADLISARVKSPK